MTLPTRPKRNWRVLAFVIGLAMFSIAEVWLLTLVSQQIGLVLTVALLVGSALSGGWLMRREGARAARRLSEEVTAGRLASASLADGALALLGGLLLILPGFLTDLAGIFCLLPWTRPLARRMLLQLTGAPTEGPINPVRTQSSEGSIVIEGEIVDQPDEPRAE